MNIIEPVFCKTCNEYIGTLRCGFKYEIYCIKDGKGVNLVTRTLTDERCPECGELLWDE